MRYLVFLLLTACATPYQPDGYKGGYKDYEVQTGIYYVYYRGNAYTSKADVVNFWHTRAAEICGGKDRYKIVDQESGYKSSVSGTATLIRTLNKPEAEGYISCLL